MTESADTGSVASGAAPAGNPDTQQTPAANGSAAGTGAWFDGLSEDNRKLAETKGWKSLDDAFASYTELDKFRGEAVRLPGEDASEEELNKFYSKLGVPESPDKYEFKVPENLPPDMAYSEELATAAKSWMHEAKIPPKQAQTIHDKWVGHMAAMQAEQVKAQAEAVEATHRDLTKEWGAENSKGYKEKLELAKRAAKELGLVDPLKKGGILLSDGALTDPTVAKALATVGEAMFREDKLDGGQAGHGSNPWAEGTLNITEQSKIAKKDPDRARRLMRAAGKDPATIRL